MTVEELTLRVFLFCLIPLSLTGIMWLVVRISLRKGWLIPRREPTELELAQERLRASLVEVQTEIGRALAPVLQGIVVAMAELFPPKPSPWQRFRRWIAR